MSKGANQKFKFSYLMKVMQEKTDDEHSLTMPQIMDELEKYGVTAEKKVCIQSSKFITQNKSCELITQIKNFVSEHKAK